MTFPHPETGELLDSREDFDRALADLTEQMMPFYRVRRALVAARAERFDVPDMPAPRYRTVAQEKVAHCPRCGGRLEDEQPMES